MSEEEKFMRQAIALAVKGKEEGGPFGALVVKDGEVIAAAYNESGIQKDPSAHAEVLAIRRACKALNNKSLKGCELYTSCEPCMMCLGTSYWADIDVIWYGCSSQDAKDNGFIYSNMFYGSQEEERKKEFNLRQVLREEALEVWK